MTIQRLTINDFRSHASTQIELGQVTILAGRIGAGKTSVLDAIATLYTGQNRFTDAKGAGLQADIRLGQSALKIQALLANGKVLTREKGSKHVLDYPGIPSDIRVGQALLYRELNTNPDTVIALLDPRLLADRTLEEQRQVILKVLRESEIAVPEAAKKVGIDAIADVAEIDKKVKWLKEDAIRDGNRVAKDLDASINTLGAALHEPPQLGDLIQKVDSLRTAQKEVIGQLAGYKAATEERERLSAQLERMGKQKGGEGLEDLKTKMEDSEKLLKLSNQALETATSDNSDRRDSANKLKSQIDNQNSMVSKIKDLGNECPTCQQSISDKFKKQLIGQLNVEINSTWRPEFDALTSQIEVKKQEIENLRREKDEVEVSCSALRARIAVEELSAKYRADLEKRLESAQARQNKKVDPDALTERQTALETELAVANKALAEARAAQDASLRRKKLISELDAQRVKTQGLEAALESLLELKKSMLSSPKLDGCIKEMSRIVKVLTGGILEYSPTSMFSVSGVPVGRMSSGQKVVFDAAFRVAAARVSDFGIVAVDDGNKLTESDRAKLLGFLAQSGVQVIVASTSEKQPTTMPEGIRGYFLTNESIFGPTKATECSYALAGAKA